jgi:hypothetical protein
MADSDRTASLMSPAKLAQMKPKAAATPAAWLNQMAADAGHLHVKRIGELGEVLQEQATSPELSAVLGQLKGLAVSLKGLDFSLLEPQGWWARTSGKSRSAGGEFLAQFEKIGEAGEELSAVAITLKKEQQADAAFTDRALVELEVEYQAIEKIIDQGARWLQDMRNQLKVRQAAAVTVTEQQQVLEDSHRCDILVSRLKQLRALCNAAAQVHEMARATAERRTDLTQTLQESLASDFKEWQTRLSTLASAAATGKTAALGLQGPIETHKELRASVKKAVATCDQLVAQEQALARTLAELSQQQPPHA